ncbi:hypothetical protein V2J09_006555 [Rumex salicifolius]
MASSNRHWPSLFKSKPHEFNSPHYSTGCKSNPFPSSDGEVERTPEPKPRWNPKPEQIRILEAIFNSGMVNPPREEIKKIRAQLQEYGQVGDANVFYWFQNRKSRSKQKNRQLKPSSVAAITPQTPPLAAVAPSSSSSSSSDRSSPNTNRPPVREISNFHHHNFQHDVAPPPPPQPYFFPVQQNGAVATGFCFNEFLGGGGGGGGGFPSLPSVTEGQMGTFSGLLLGDMMGGGGGGAAVRRMFEDEEKLRFEAEELSFLVTNPNETNTISFTQLQGESGRQMISPAPKSTVFINDVSFEVPSVGPFNVREAFGEDVVLFHQTGHPVPTNEWGLTLHPLQHGASYFLVRTLASKHHGAIAHHLPASEFPFQL